MPPSDHQSYAVYWSIYTDFRGRQQFRKLYWDRLKDLIGRPAKLIGIEREYLWPSGAPSHELRCHVWRNFSAASDTEAISYTFRSACRVASAWKPFAAPVWDPMGSQANDDVFEMVWYRNTDNRASDQLELPCLTTIMVSVRRDMGFRVRPGFTVAGGGASEPDLSHPVLSRHVSQGNFAVTWHVHVQTSNKRALMETHWPLLQDRFGKDAEMIDLEKRSGDIGPFKFSIRQSLPLIGDDELIRKLLDQSDGLAVTLQTATDGGVTSMRGVRSGSRPLVAHALMGFDAIRLA